MKCRAALKSERRLRESVVGAATPGSEPATYCCRDCGHSWTGILTSTTIYCQVCGQSHIVHQGKKTSKKGDEPHFHPSAGSPLLKITGGNINV